MDGVRLKDVYPGATKFEMFKYNLARSIRKLVRFTIFSLIISGISIAVFMYYFPNKEIIQQVTIEAKAEYPVLDRIAKCESENRHFGESGQVLFNGNKNGTVDVGRFMINTVWFKKATELGLDVTREKDNRLMAEYIYKNFGTEAWVYSKHCWNK